MTTLQIVGEGEVVFFSAKCWDHRNRADLVESATPCHDASWRCGVLPGIEPTPPDCSGCNVKGLHYGATTSSLARVIQRHVVIAWVQTMPKEKV